MSVIQYGQVHQNGQALLKELGLVDQEAEEAGTQSGRKTGRRSDLQDNGI